MPVDSKDRYSLLKRIEEVELEAKYSADLTPPYTVEEIYYSFLYPLLLRAADKGQHSRTISRWELKNELPRYINVSDLTKFAKEEKGIICHEYADVVVFSW